MIKEHDLKKLKISGASTMALVFEFLRYFQLLALVELKRSVTLLGTLNGTHDGFNFSLSMIMNTWLITLWVKSASV